MHLWTCNPATLDPHKAPVEQLFMLRGKHTLVSHLLKQKKASTSVLRLQVLDFHKPGTTWISCFKGCNTWIAYKTTYTLALNASLQEVLISLRYFVIMLFPVGWFSFPCFIPINCFLFWPTISTLILLILETTDLCSVWTSLIYDL